jgi:Na+-transporting NADH:ubiquinone oxidoreductase subunit C
VANNDTIQKTLTVALALCIVCSVIVSGAAVILKPLQIANVQLDMKRNILGAAGMLDEDVDIDEQFAQITPRLIDLRSGRFSEEIEAEGYDQIKAAKDPALSEELSAAQDQANIGRREDFALVYLVGEANNPDTVILPVRGAGLWGQLFGFLALENDFNTVAGLGFYEHKETPGLGGEVDNPRWKALWPGKQVYRDGDVAIHLLKGAVDRSGPNADYQIDGLSGATLTGRGVSNLVQFWMGEHGYGPFLTKLKAGEA